MKMKIKEIRLDPDCDCKECNDLCYNYIHHRLCTVKTCKAIKCNNRGPLSFDFFELKPFDGKGYGLVAKKNIPR